MADVANTNMEKHYFTFILDNPEQFNKVTPEFFLNRDISFVFAVIREEYLRSAKHLVPSPNQVKTMVRLADTENKISDKVVTLLMESDNADIGDDWLIPRFKAWKIKNQLREDINGAIDLVRGISDVNYENTIEIAQKLKLKFDSVLTVDDDDNDLGSDFSDPESHKQNMAKNCISSGWATMNTVLGGGNPNGGWSKSTFNVIMGETNVGKCCSLNTCISIRNKQTGEIKRIKIGDFYNILKNKI